MAISFDKENKIFKLDAGNSSYIMQVSKHGFLYHKYYGAHVSDTDLNHVVRFAGGASFSPSPADALELSLDILALEYPGAGIGDFRVPAIKTVDEKGSSSIDLRYDSYRILDEKPALEGLPSTYLNDNNEAKTLEITLKDTLTGLSVKLYYCAFETIDAITRWAVIENEGKQTLRLNYALSACVEFPVRDFDMIALHGAHAVERWVERKPIGFGTQSIQSRRGSSGHQLNPFMMLCSKTATEDCGDAYGFNLVYSGNFLIETEVSQMGTTRVVIGVNPYDFEWELAAGKSFTTPEAVIVYSAEGLGGMSRTYHRLYRKNLCRGVWRDKKRPILVNNWEATYFDFNADKLVDIAKEAAKAGIEMLVMDDGWFGKRDKDISGLGDWFVNEKKLGCSLNELVERVKAEGLRFGIWFEPEMISEDSDLYRAHPDWCLHVPGRPKSVGRMQYVLNMSKKEVCDYLVDCITKVLESADISYVKWDFNRNITEAFSDTLPPPKGREVLHRYVLGLYDVMERLNTKFPQILFESCSGGGGRFDPGMLYYMPQTWTSDNTDSMERLKIQYGTSFAYPVCSMGAHVSAVPNHQTGRITPFKTRGEVALAGTFGYELDLTKLSQEEKDLMKEQVAMFHKYHNVIFNGDYYRLISPFEKTEAAWMFVSPDKSEAFLQYFRVLYCYNLPATIIKLKGLDPKTKYRIEETGLEVYGDTLMNAGIVMPELYGDFNGFCFTIKKI